METSGSRGSTRNEVGDRGWLGRVISGGGEEFKNGESLGTFFIIIFMVDC